MMASDVIYLFAKGKDLVLSCQCALEESLAGAMGQKGTLLGGQVQQPWCFGTTLHGKKTLHGRKRVGIKVSPLLLGRDLRKEGGKDNFPEAS